MEKCTGFLENADVDVFFLKKQMYMDFEIFWKMQMQIRLVLQMRGNVDVDGMDKK